MSESTAVTHSENPQSFLVQKLLMRSVEELQAGTVGADVAVQQISPGKLESEWSIALIGSIAFNRYSVNRDMVARGHRTAGMTFLFPILAQSERSHFRQRQLREGQLLLHNADAIIDHHAADNLLQYSLGIKEQTLIEQAEIQYDSSLCEAIRHQRPLAVSPLRFKSFSDWLLHQTDHCIGAPAFAVSKAIDPSFNSFESRKMHRVAAVGFNPQELEQEAIDRFLAILSEAADADYADPDAPTRRDIFRRADELMRANLMVPLSASQICKAIGCSRRTLYYSFGALFDMTPLVYYKSMRMNAARQALLNNKDGEKIYQIASRFGFPHAGQFSIDYMKLFGESPSATMLGRKAS
ncbi:MAG: Right origin-binding protein [Planctomycetota bacterium]|jgi:AraC-like DNA-binding protein